MVRAIREGRAATRTGRAVAKVCVCAALAATPPVLPGEASADARERARPDRHPARRLLFSAGPPSPADLSDPRLVGLKAVGFFDPVSEQPDFEGLIPAAPIGLREPDGAYRYHLAQLDGPVDVTARRRFADAGIRVIGYVPNNALVLGLPPGSAEEMLREVRGVRHVGPFLPGYKLDEKLFGLMRDESGGEASATSILVELFPGEDAVFLLRTVASRFEATRVGATLVRPGGPFESSTVTFEVRRDALEDAVGLFLHDPSVAFVSRLTPLRTYNDNAVWVGQSYDRTSGPAEASAADPKPYTNSATIWRRGLIGTGQIVAVADTGIEYETCFWDDPGRPVIPQQVDPPGSLALDTQHRKILAVNGVNSFTLDFDGTWRHGTHVATTVAGDDLAHPTDGTLSGHDHGDGLAPGARIVFEDIGGPQGGDCSTTLWVSSVADLLEQEYEAGARISTNSWGTGDDRTDEVDSTVWAHEDFLVLFSAGNEGVGGVNEIATNKNALAVGASENYDADFVDQFGILDPENMAAFSSVGPAADGRVKPDIVAPGYRLFSNRYMTRYFSDEADCDPGDPSVEVCFPSFGGCYFTYTGDPCAVNSLLGTSMAAPAAAGLAALARQYFTDGFHPSGLASPNDSRQPSAALLKAILVNGARNMTGHRYERRGSSKQDFGPLADAPSDVQGWGRVVLDDALYFDGDARRLEIVDVANAEGLVTGEAVTLRLAAVGQGEPLKLTLVWTDPPAQSYSAAALVNDLDLELEAPHGAVYRGNQWTADDVNVPGDKVSAANPPGTDALNNVEGILIPRPDLGLHTVTVRGVDVPGHQGSFTQGYALVITGAATASPGSVPDGAGTAGVPLKVAKAGGGDVTVTWSESCLPTATDYEIYEGTLRNFASHAPRFCSTGGSTSMTFTPAAGSTYYLAVPRVGDREGSYGRDGGGIERPQSPSACLPRHLGPCS